MNKKFSLPLIVTILILLSMACGLSGPSAVPTSTLPSPDFTLTAIFSAVGTLTAIAPTHTTEALATATSPATPSNTPEPIIPTDTATTAPTATPIPPTATATSTTIPSSTPTKTQPPATATPTPMSRPGAGISAYYFSSPPTIDGSLGDWDLDWISVNNVIFGKDNWSGSADLSAQVVFGWDRNYLYVVVKVMDDTYVASPSGADLYKGDGLEILLDTNLSSDYKSEALSSDDYQLGISAGDLTKNDKGAAYLWYPDSHAGTKSKVIIQGRPTDSGYRIEAAIPWSVFGMTPQAGWHYGFAFSVSDNDNPASHTQQTMVSNVKDRKLTDPTTWGTLILK